MKYPHPVNLVRFVGFLWIALASMLTSFAARETLNINPVWRFQLADPAEAHQVDYDDSAWDVASLPHSFRIWREDLTGYENLGRKVGWYRREIEIPRSAAKKKIFLVNPVLISAR